MNVIKSKVTEALILDNEKSYKEAYSMYLKSSTAIVENLQLDFDGFGVSGESSKLLRLGQQCLERMLDIINHLPIYKTRPRLPSVTSPLSPGQRQPLPSNPSNTVINAGVPDLPEVPTFEPTSRRRSKAHPGSPKEPITKSEEAPSAPDSLPVFPTVPGGGISKERTLDDFPSVPSVISPAGIPGNPVPGETNRPNVLIIGKALSPVEAAKLQNQRLLAAYRSRVSASQSNKGQVATLNLSLQRRLAENVAVAKAREESLMKKQRDRNRRLQDQAARSLHSTVGMSHDELERRQFYYNVLQFENNSKALLSWRERLKANPTDLGQIQTLITYLLSVKNHPFTQMLHKYQYTTYNRVLPLIDKYSSRFEQSASSQGQQNNNSISSMYCTKEARSRTQSVEADSLFNYSQSSSHMGTPESGHLGNLLSHPQASSQSSSPCAHLSVISTESDSKDEGVVSDLHDNKEDASVEPNESDGANSPTIDSYDVISPSEPKQITFVANIETMEKEALQRHLDNVVGDVHEFLGKLRSLLVVTYQELDTPEAKDTCYASLEAPFYKPVWGYIIALYRIVHKDKEDDLRRVFEAHRHFTPADIGVAEKYCLDDGLPSPYSHPYQPAVSELRKVTECTSPLTKLECIVKSSRTICTCVEEHFTRWEKQQSVNLGADDLLPILSYVILKSELPLLLAESHALMEFIDEGYLMGEEGYCLTSLQTALGYVLTLCDESTEDFSLQTEP